MAPQALRKASRPCAARSALTRAALPARAGASALQKHFRSEMLSYRRDPNGAIVKQFDHGPDAARALLSLDQAL